MTYYTLNPPVQWRAGFVGAERTPFYFGCADCEAKDPEIAGFISSDGTFAGIGLLPAAPKSTFVKPAMFCRECDAKRRTEAK
jgi:hypothetical protein